jgi:flagellin-like hook-associated protein FlgL
MAPRLRKSRQSDTPEEETIMSEVTLSKAVRSNLLNLQSTATLLGKSQERLSSGLRVNSAMDNPTNFFTAQGLNSRANDLGQLADAVSNAVQTVAAADKGITAITKLVESAQATARQALQTAATISESTTTGASPEHIATVTGGTYVAPSGSAATLTINSTNITIADGATIGAAITAINAQSGSTNVSAAEGTGADAGKIVLTATAGNNVSVGSTAAGFTSGASDTYAAANAGTTTTTSVPNPKRAELVDTYNELLGQIDQLAKDSGFNGVNLLNGDNLSVLFNEDGSSKLDISGVTNNQAGLGLSTLASTAFDSNASINTTLDDLKGAIDTLRSQAAKFGANLSVVETRQDFTKQMINVLQTGAANLTLADTNEEAANVLALQTRQQLSSTALSLASQADQNVLRLF